MATCTLPIVLFFLFLFVYYIMEYTSPANTHWSLPHRWDLGRKRSHEQHTDRECTERKEFKFSFGLLCSRFPCLKAVKVFRKIIGDEFTRLSVLFKKNYPILFTHVQRASLAAYIQKRGQRSFVRYLVYKKSAGAVSLITHRSAPLTNDILDTSETDRSFVLTTYLRFYFLY